MLTHKILKKYPINNAPYLVQSIDSNYNESYYSQKCWITSLGDFNNESDNLQNLCFSKLCTYTDSEELLSNNYPTEICKNLEYEIKDLELMKNNLKKEFKNIDTEIEQFEMLPELTKDINNTLNQQILQAKLYHYLDCSRKR